MTDCFAAGGLVMWIGGPDFLQLGGYERDDITDPTVIDCFVGDLASGRLVADFWSATMQMRMMWRSWMNDFVMWIDLIRM